MATGYTFYLARSSDLQQIGEFTICSGRTLTVGLNKAGNANITVSMDDPIAASIATLTTCIIVRLNGIIVWSGPVWTTEENVSGTDRSINVSAVGWFELLNHRVIRSEYDESLNYIPNGNFSNGTTGWSPIVIVIATIYTATTTYTSPPANLTLSSSSGPTQGASADATTFGGPLLGGANYRVRAKVYNPSFGGLPGFRRFQFQTTSLTVSNFVIDASVFAQNTWKQVEYVHPAAVGLTRLSTSVQVTGAPIGTANGQMAVDDIEIHREIKYTTTNTNTIARELIKYTNRNVPTGITLGLDATTWPITTKYQPFSNIGEEIQRLSQVENGFDWDINPSTRAFNIYYPYKGNIKTQYPAPVTSAILGGASHYYAMDEPSGTTANDAVGSKNGTHVGGVTVNQTTLASFDPGGASYDLNGTTGYVSLPTMDLSLKSWSFSCLVNIDTIAARNQLFNAYTVNQQDYQISLAVEAGGALLLGFYNAARIAPTGLLSISTTYHVAFTYDSTTKIGRMYVNGVLVDQGVYTGVMLGTNPFVALGANLTTGVVSSPFNGRMDNVGIWIGRTLSASEVYYQYLSNRLRVQNPDYIRLGYKWGPDNLEGVRRSVDPSKLRNWFVTQGKGSTTNTSALAQDLASITTYGAFEDTISIGEVSNLDVIAAYSNAEIAIRRSPLTKYDINMKSQADASVPILFQDFNIGDVVSVTARDGTLVVTDQNVRVFGATLEVDQFGVGKVTNLETGL